MLTVLVCEFCSQDMQLVVACVVDYRERECASGIVSVVVPYFSSKQIEFLF